jgi:5-methylcytosine-specific restriction protein B
MESREAIPLWDVENDDVPKMIELPKNLFIVGTINVDETTYMFSPKVLDRANVIEFRINKTQMSEYLSGPCELKELVKMPECAADFVRIATASKTQDALSGEVKKTLVSMFEALSLIQKEFGYRTASEMSRYIGLAKSYAGMSDNDAVDSAIVQKLLPKVHGSRKKVAPILKSLWMVCYSGEASEIDSIEYMPSMDLFKYPLTAEKVWRMYSTAQDNGFTSFAEA